MARVSNMCTLNMRCYLRKGCDCTSCPLQVTNNPDRAEDYPKRAEEVEEAQVTVGHRSSDGRLVLMGRGDTSGSVRETVRRL